MKVLNRNMQEHGLHRLALVDLVGRKQTDQIQKPALKILTSVELFCEVQFGCQSERFLKTIKSEFGDIILIITTKEIY